MLPSQKTSQSIATKIRIPNFDPNHLRKWQEAVIHAAHILDISHLLQQRATIKPKQYNDIIKQLLPDNNLTSSTSSNTQAEPELDTNDNNTNDNESSIIPPNSSTTTTPDKSSDTSKHHIQDLTQTFSGFTLTNTDDTFATKTTTTELSDKLLDTLLQEYIFYINGIEETKSQRTERLYFYQLLYNSLRNHKHLITNIKTGDVRGLWDRASTLGQANTLQVLQQNTRKLIEHIKNTTYLFS